LEIIISVGFSSKNGESAGWLGDFCYICSRIHDAFKRKMI
jgi:hypothetical protein